MDGARPGTMGALQAPRNAAAERPHRRQSPPHLLGHAMDQRYIDTVRACKTILRNMDYLDETITEGQRQELGRLFFKVHETVASFLVAEEEDLGRWVGEE